MQIVTLVISIISLITALLSYRKKVSTRAQMRQIAFMIWDSLLEIHQESQRLFASLTIHQNSSRSSNYSALLFGMERWLRRISLFILDEDILFRSLLWFKENAICEDRTYIQRSLQYGCISRFKAKQLAKSIIKKIDERLTE